MLRCLLLELSGGVQPDTEEFFLQVKPPSQREARLRETLSHMVDPVRICQTLPVPQCWLGSPSLIFSWQVNKRITFARNIQPYLVLSLGFSMRINSLL